MKILAIRGENLASLETRFDIDFTQPPLSTAGLFAITGVTGSGKSTLLDAMCLALYDTTPRLESVGKGDDIKDVDNKFISSSSSTSILRRGASKCFAEVDFIGIDGNRYRSHWSVARARNKATGTIQNVVMSLKNLNTDTLFNGTKTQVKAKLVEVIGLTFAQFHRTILLAQGEFATFLKSKDDEKAELLEKLTGTEIYSQLSMLIFQNNKQATEEWKTAYSLIQNDEQQLLSDEVVAQYKAEIEANTTTVRGMEEQEKALNGTMNWLTRFEELTTQLNQCTQRQEIQQKVFVDSKPRREKLKEVEDAEAIRPTYQSYVSEQKQLQQLRVTIDENQKLLAQQEILLAEKKEALEACQTTLDSHIETMEKNDPVLKKAREMDVKLEALKQEIENKRTEKEELDKTIDNQNKKIENTQKELATDGNKLAEQESWLNTHRNRETLVDKLSLLNEKITEIHTAKQTITSTQGALDSSVKQLEISETTIGQLLENLSALEEVLPTEVIVLRKRLGKGVPCPVCGSEHYDMEALNDENASMNTKELEDKRQEIQHKIDKCRSEQETIKANITKYTTTVETSQRTLNDLMKHIETEVSPFVPDWQQMLDKRLLATTLSELVGEWQSTNNSVQMLKNKQELLLKQQTLLKENLDELTKQHTSKTTYLNDLINKFESQQTERQSILGGQSADVVENKLKQQKQELEKQQKLANEAYNQVFEKLNTYKGKAQSLNDSLQKTTATSAELNDQFALWATQHQMTTDHLTELMKISSEWINDERKELNKQQEELVVAQEMQKQKQTELNSHLKLDDKPKEDIALDELKTSLTLLQTQLNEKKELITKRKFELDADQKKRNAIASQKTKCDALQEVKERWEKLNDLFGSSDGKKFKQIAQGYTLDWLLLHANVHLQTLSPRYELERVNYDKLGLQVVDKDMLNEVRSVNSLSGGESFLVSLALALGLSSLSSDRMNIESLFIDEGFGSLDADTLQVAMSALDALQTQGRRVGVISHVKEMTEVIGTQIHVKRISNGKSAIEILTR